MVAEDGRNYLLGTSERFDVIVADLFMPWKAGVGKPAQLGALRGRVRPAEGWRTLRAVASTLPNVPEGARGRPARCVKFLRW